MNDRLEGWGEIAAHLRRDVRTTQRWERQEGLPVHRHPGVKPRVWALRSELDAWWYTRESAAAPAERPHGEQARPRSKSKRWVWIALFLGVFGMAVAVVVAFRTSQTPETNVADRIFALAEVDATATHSVQLKGVPGTPILPADGKELYVLDQHGAPEIQVVDLEQLTVQQPIKVAGKPVSMALSPDHNTLFIGTMTDGLYAFNRKTKGVKVIRQNIRGQVRSLACTPDGRILYLALEKAGLAHYDTTSGTVSAVKGFVCPEGLAIDSSGKHLYVSSRCGGSGGSMAHDTVDVLEIATNKIVGVLGGKPMVAGPVHLLPDNGRIWVTGGDACMNPDYSKYTTEECPFFPGTIHHIFRLSDRRWLRTLAAPTDMPINDATFTPDGQRAILGGTPVRVIDTSLFDELETFSTDRFLSNPRIDSHRKRVYFASGDPPEIFIIDLPKADCDPPSPGLLHHWPGDGNNKDRRFHWPLTWAGDAKFAPALVGRGFALEDASLVLRKDASRLNALAFREGTLQMWIKLTKAGSGVIAEMRAPEKPRWSVCISAQQQLSLNSGERSVLGRSRISQEQWHHIAIIRIGESVSVHLDGDIEIKASIPTDTAPAGYRFGPIPGILDELALYDMPLSKAEMEAMIASTKRCAGKVTTVRSGK